jgi:hypothetical protein
LGIGQPPLISFPDYVWVVDMGAIHQPAMEVLRGPLHVAGSRHFRQKSLLLLILLLDEPTPILFGALRPPGWLGRVLKGLWQAGEFTHMRLFLCFTH